MSSFKTTTSITAAFAPWSCVRSLPISNVPKPPGNVLLDPGEANLSKSSVVNISQIFTVDRSQLDEKIGTLSPQRVRQILDGLYLLLEPSHDEE